MSKPDRDNRQYIRHPSNIPLQYSLIDKPQLEPRLANNVSLGGLSFSANEVLKLDSWLTLNISTHHNEFEVDAQVRWCRATRTSSPHTLFDVGVSFSGNLDMFSIRMIEQVCHIESYKKCVLKNEDRILSNDEAAAEWIEKFASDFPQSPNNN